VMNSNVCVRSCVSQTILIVVVVAVVVVVVVQRNDHLRGCSDRCIHQLIKLII